MNLIRKIDKIRKFRVKNLILQNIILGLVYSSIILMTILLAESNHGLNIDTLNLDELWGPIILMVAISVPVSIGCAWVFKKKPLTAILSSMVLISIIVFYQQIALFLITKFGRITLSNTPLFRMFYVFIFVELVFMIFLIEKHIIQKKDKSKETMLIAMLIIFCIFIFNIFNLLTHLTKTWAQRSYKPEMLTSNINSAQGYKPNIYYIVLDRHSNANVLATQLGYKSTTLSSALKNNNFFVNDNAYSSYPNTASSIASTLSADYINNLNKEFSNSTVKTELPLYSISRNSPIVNEFIKLGYQYKIVGNWYGSSNKSSYTNDVYWGGSYIKIKNVKINLSEFGDYLVSQNFFTNILRKMNLIKSSDVSGPTGQIDELNKIAESKQGGVFIYAHILLTHPPYLFNADGSTYDEKSSTKTPKEKYLDQLEYADRQISSLINKINLQSKGKDIIVLQSDEGFYPQEGINGSTHSLSNDMTQWSTKDLEAKYGILAAYYLPGVSRSEIAEAANSVNIFRLVLNNYFGYKLQYLPVCNLAPKDAANNLYKYVDITQRLSGENSQTCKQYT